MGSERRNSLRRYNSPFSGEKAAGEPCGLQETIVKLENRNMEAIRDHDEAAAPPPVRSGKLITYADGSRQTFEEFLQAQKKWTILGFKMSEPQFWQHPRIRAF